MGNKRPAWFQSIFKAAGLFFVGCAGATSAWAANTCPWMNEATASGLLGGQVVGSYSAHRLAQPAQCTFTHHGSGIVRSLEIQIDTVPDAKAHLKELESACTANRVPLQAIGNEAILCIPANRGGEIDGRALGRVRDQVFTIRIKSSQKKDSLLSDDALQKLIVTAAEQVSGNLF